MRAKTKPAAPPNKSLEFLDRPARIPVLNAVLRDLPAGEYASLRDNLEFVNLPKHKILNEPGEPIEFAYFINSGLVSFLSVLANKRSVEVGLAGRDGFVGLPLIVGYVTSAHRAVMQIAGTGFRIRAAKLTSSLPKCPALNQNLQRFSQVLASQATQIAACNRLHEIDRRLARWLLMSQDRVNGEAIALSQETLSNMLGTRRASVTVAAGILQKAGFITCRRASVEINKRRGLEKYACECYEAMKRQADKWRAETNGHPSKSFIDQSCE